MQWYDLTYRGLNKMAYIFADNTFKCILLTGNLEILFSISQKFVSKAAIYSKSILLQVMA